jgi:hypothetical protein
MRMSALSVWFAAAATGASILAAATNAPMAATGGAEPTGPRVGQNIFRYDTFGDEQLWTGVLRLNESLAAVSPNAALAAGLKVDVDALPPVIVNGLREGTVDLDSPAVTLELLQRDAVVGVRASVDGAAVTKVGVTCALCHSTVDDALTPGVGHRRDGWANVDLNVGEIVALSPILDDNTKAVFRSWGPGKYDPRHHAFDGTSIISLNSPSIPVVLPPIYGLKHVGFETYTADGPISYWNRYVAVTQMGGHGSFEDERIGLSVVQTPDLVAPKLAALRAYQLTLHAPGPGPGVVDRMAAARGKMLFESARCSSCHVPPHFTDVSSGPDPTVPVLHDAAEIGVDPAYALRSATAGDAMDKVGRYRTTPLRGLLQHPPYFHDGSAVDLRAVVDHYDRWFGLHLSVQEKSDLVAYLETL